MIAEGQDVVIYKGVDLDLPLINLNTKLATSPYHLDDLGEEFKVKIRSGVDKASREQIDSYLRSARCAYVLPTAAAGGAFVVDDLYRLGLRRPVYQPVGNLPPPPAGLHPILTWIPPTPVDAEVQSCKERP